MAELLRELEITSLVHGGRGIGHCDGKAVFVPLTMPGDLVNCRVIKSKRRYAEAELVEVVQPSPLRRQPPCPFFGACGGCQWQHLPYIEQLRWKERTFSDLMTRNHIVAEERIKPIVQAPDEWSYRNRVQLKCHFTAEGLAIGFFRHGSHSVVDIDKCRLIASPIQSVVDLLRRELVDMPRPDCLVQIDVACGDDGEVRTVMHVLPRGRRQLRPWLQELAGRHQLNVFMQSGENLEVVHGESDLVVKVDQPELQLRYGPGGFVQVNSSQNRRMVEEMLTLLNLDGSERVLDLFCGMGNFSLPVARRAGQVIGVEDYAPSIASARVNAAINKVDNVEFRIDDASTLLSGCQKDDNLDLVILDPPRSGHYQASADLLQARPRRILYVSCDPATLARDLSPLVRDGYEVLSSQPFDLFPQTWHIESMTLLEATRL